MRFRCKSLSAILAFIVCVICHNAVAHPGSGIAVDKSSQIFFVDTGSGLWKVDTAGKVSKIADAKYHWIALDEKNAFTKTQLPKGANSDIVTAGSNPTVLLSSDYPIVVGTDGNLYYAQMTGGRALQMMKMTPAGAVSAVGAIPAGKNGPLSWINGLAVGPDGAIYYTDDNSIWRMTLKGQATTVVTIASPVGAKLTPGYTLDMGPMLRGLAVDEKGVINVASIADGRVLKVTPDGKVTTLLQVDAPWSPTAVAVHGADVYVQEYLHTTVEDRMQWLPRFRRITSEGTSTIIATVDKMPGARR